MTEENEKPEHFSCQRLGMSCKRNISAWMIVQQVAMSEEIFILSKNKCLNKWETDYEKISKTYKEMINLWETEAAKVPDIALAYCRPQLVPCVLQDVNIVDPSAFALDPSAFALDPI